MTSRYIVCQVTGTEIRMYDFTGAMVRTGSRNQNSNGTASNFSFVHLPQLDALGYRANDYAVTYASFDYGQTW
ncbi:hypothetical protein AFCDBAGC_4435 [Methylobacterium cerastii]|uniref:Uncharacterized protein n=2 Tax=Methylobacterium cerastii TaxID=932741 RepID=A0ABQ4QMS0_9HYPH|nr:hypothetical protein AFCDBAGC_4435 [Methylobacterium cerastii]